MFPKKFLLSNFCILHLLCFPRVLQTTMRIFLCHFLRTLLFFNQCLPLNSLTSLHNPHPVFFSSFLTLARRQNCTVDNKQTQVLHSHPITMKGIFLARNSQRSTMRVSQRNTISLPFHLLSHVLHTKEKKSDTVYPTPARAISWGWLNKDSTNCDTNKDGKHLLLALGPCWPRGFSLWSAVLTFLQELWGNALNTHSVTVKHSHNERD